MAGVQSSCLGQLLEMKKARACHSLENGWHRVLLACYYTPPHPELGWEASHAAGPPKGEGKEVRPYALAQTMLVTSSSEEQKRS